PPPPSPLFPYTTLFRSHNRSFRFQQPEAHSIIAKLATPIPLPGEAAFLTLTENRYVGIPGSTKTANCSYVERWAANLKESCDDRSEEHTSELQSRFDLV